MVLRSFRTIVVYIHCTMSIKRNQIGVWAILFIKKQSGIHAITLAQNNIRDSFDNVNSNVNFENFVLEIYVISWKTQKISEIKTADLSFLFVISSVISQKLGGIFMLMSTE